MDRQEWLGHVEKLGLKYIIADQTGEIRAMFSRKDDADSWIKGWGNHNGWGDLQQTDPRFWRVPE